MAAEPRLSKNRSKLKELIASIATIPGDLSNITVPPFILDTKSTVELPSFWAERPSIFVAPAAAADPAERALFVLKWFISSLRNQQYAGRSEAEGVKKPINAFLGELFLATCGNVQDQDGVGVTRLVSEQVSHHPPVTACRVWNEKHGVSAEGYTRQEITFTGSINIQQIGHATFHLAQHHETYLIPFPDIKIRGLLTGTPYPELQGTHHIPSTSGYTSTIDFSGRGFLSSSDRKHSFQAKVYREGKGDAAPIYTISGRWNGQFVIHDCKQNVDIETFDVTKSKTTPLITDTIEEQDPWESRRAWQGVRKALQCGDMQAAADAKARIENGQREMRKTDNDGRDWKRLFFEPVSRTDEVTGLLARKVGLILNPADTVAAWKFRRREWEDGMFRKPYHGALMPDNSQDRAGEGEKNVTDGVSHVADSQTPLPSGEPRHDQPNRSITQLNTRTTSVIATRRQPTVDAKADTKAKAELAQVNGARYTHPKSLNLAETAKSGVEGMTAQEKARVEEFLRDKLITRRR